MKKFLLKLWKDEEGAELVEWVVIVALIAAAAVVTYQLLSARISGVMDNVLTYVESQVPTGS